MKRLLFLSRWLPYPPNNGSKLRIYNLLCGLKQNYEISLLTFIDPIERDIDLTHLYQLCTDVDTVPWQSPQHSITGALLGLLNAKPRYLVATFSQEMKQRIERSLATGGFDVVLASEVDMAVYRRYFGDIPALFEDLELAVIFEKYAGARTSVRRLRHYITWVKYRRYLASLLQLYDACTVVSDEEMALVQRAAPGYKSVEVVPNCVDIGSYKDAHTEMQQYRMIFTGSFTYRVNYEAMVWFVRDVFPIVRKEIPDASLIITGDHADLPLPDLSNVKLTGFMDDIRPLIAGSWVSIAPIREGSGTRIKILEAMALRTPVVATSKGAEGLDAQHMTQLVIADTVEDFANSIIQLFRDPMLRNRLANNAYQLVSEQYNWTKVMPRFLELIDHISQKH